MNVFRKVILGALSIAYVGTIASAPVLASRVGEGMKGHDVVPNIITDEASDYDFSSVKEGVQNLIDNGHTGSAVMVLKDGKVQYEDYFGYEAKYKEGTDIFNDHQSVLLDESDWDAVDENTMWDMASVSKMLSTNLALQKLVYEGKLDLDATVSTYIPEYRDYDEVTSLLKPEAQSLQHKDLITVKMLLHHEAGQAPDPQYHNDNYLKSQAAADYMGFATAGSAYDTLYIEPQTDPSDRTKALEAICKTPITTMPGTAIAYSDVDYMLLGLIIESITGMPQDQYVENEIYAPLGLTHTMYNPLQKGFTQEDIAATEINGNSRDGYRTVDGHNANEYAFTGMRTYTLRGEVHDEKAYYTLAGVAGHAGIFSTPHDVAILYQLMLNNGTYNGVTLFDKETVDMFLEPNDIINDGGYTNSTYALGWYTNDVDYQWGSTNWPTYFSYYADYSTFGHQGWSGPVAFADPENNIVVVYMRNRPHNPVVGPEYPNSFVNSGTGASTYRMVAERIYRDAFGFDTYVSSLPNIGEEKEVIVNDFEANPTVKVDVDLLSPLSNKKITKVDYRSLKVTRVDCGDPAPEVPTDYDGPEGSSDLLEPADWHAKGASYYFNASEEGDYYVSLYNDNSGLHDVKMKKYITVVDAKEPTATVAYDTNGETKGPVKATISVSKKVNDIEGWTKVESTGRSVVEQYEKVYTENAEETVNLVYKNGHKGSVNVRVTNIVKDGSSNKPNTDQPSKPGSSNTNKNDPSIGTGDQTNIMFFAGLLIVGLSAGLYILNKRKLNNKGY
ncbi:LPXTG-motif cell wall-anchored protein [Breznakia blatticola]|uniref:LPXTG-motif cell wall-anchored protein n=1 Tax=Breznakia blatticola TaxID=1754012 RepID=A0A4R7ZIX0_9FIRM|nr:serine hydrolase [Breznakia blatticola]TDW16328.1 LPXTG-motif cell wall-anchored protein [Breznakia blatticola]